MGIAWATVFINTSRPALEINFSFHPMTHFVIFALNSLKDFTLDKPVTMGNPRYFSQICHNLSPQYALDSCPHFRSYIAIEEQGCFTLVYGLAGCTLILLQYGFQLLAIIHCCLAEEQAIICK